MQAPRLTLVIPAYNEAARIQATLNAAHTFLALRFPTFELIVANDGSSDRTAAIASAFAADHGQTTVLSIAHGGKAAAVRAGMAAAMGRIVAFTDADLATPLHYLDDFAARIEAGAGVVIGSREGAGARRIGEPSYRHVMGRVFNRLVQLLLLPGIEDTQCGFKVFRRDCADEILRRSLLYRQHAPVQGPRVTAFDVELIVIANRIGCRVESVPVIWTYGEQSKVNAWRDTLNNALDIAKIKLHQVRGRYD